MDDPTRSLLGSAPPEGSNEPSEAGAPSSEPAPRVSEPSSDRPSRDAKFIGDAMRSLYRSSETSIERGDATRVISRALPEPTRPAPSQRPISSSPPGPRVDVALWVVLALGLFAIAGVMLSAAL